MIIPTVQHWARAKRERKLIFYTNMNAESVFGIQTSTSEIPQTLMS